MKRSIFLLFGASIILTSLSVKAEEVIFDNPQVSGYGLDYCKEWGTQCGAPAADAFCQSEGYPRAKNFRFIKNNQKTRTIGGGQVCDGEMCSRITQITCQSPIFDDPQVSGYGLDYCREWGTNCGYPAATAFCRLEGFSKAISFKYIKGNQKTRTINGGQVCDGEMCSRINKITCQ